LGLTPYLSASMSIASVIRSLAVRCVSVTMCRSVFHFSTVTVEAHIYLGLQSLAPVNRRRVLVRAAR
jgi:hypothetical protein